MKKRPALSLSLAASDKDEQAPAAELTASHSFGASGGGSLSTTTASNTASSQFTEAIEAASSMPAAVSYDDIEFLRTLGKGCSSVVSLVRSKKTGELFALKQLALFDKGVRAMLLAELKALYSADCEALVGFYGAAYREGEVGCLLEFCDQGGLDTVLRRAPGRKIPESALAAIGFQILFGLGYLAFERRVHRDLKPANILMCSSGRVVLTDFGISRELSTAVLAKTFIGSFLFMSPERIKHEPYSYSSDIWSLGLVLLECALGRYPYSSLSEGGKDGGASQIAMVLTITEGDEPLPGPDSGFSPEFRSFLAKCIVKDPAKRASAAELLEEPWFEKHGVLSLEDAVEKTRAWLESAGFKDEYTHLRGVKTAPTGAATGPGPGTGTAATGAGAH